MASSNCHQSNQPSVGDAALVVLELDVPMGPVRTVCPWNGRSDRGCDALLAREPEVGMGKHSCAHSNSLNTMALRKPTRVLIPTTLPPPRCTASGIIVEAIMVNIAPTATPSIATRKECGIASPRL